MHSINVPLPEFNFESVIKGKLKGLTNQYVTSGNITHGYIGAEQILKDEIQKILWELRERKQKAFFIGELIIHINQLKKEYDANARNYFPKDKFRLTQAIELHEETLLKFDTLLFYLYNMLSENGIIVDGDAFTFEEANTVNTKLNEILSALETLKIGHEALGEELQDIKEQITNLSSSTPLGKKPFYQRATGMALHFATDKTVDVVWDTIKPLFSDLLLHQIPHKIVDILALNP